MVDLLKNKFDVLVVGAGPSGVSAAYHLKKTDVDNRINVDLIERLNPEKYQTYHDICGEGISKSLIDELNPLKPKGILEKIEKIKEYWPGNIRITTKMNGYLIDRIQFLNSIIDEFKKLGGNYFLNSVKTIDQRNNNVKVKFKDHKKTYDFIIAADGANSIIRKYLGIEGKTKPFIQYIVDKKPQKGVLEFYYDQKYKGDYMWIFPHESNSKIGFPLIPGNKFKPKEKIITKQSRLIGYGGVSKYVSENVLLVGDAACQTNPITKGGIRPGMIAGKIAARAILNNNIQEYEKKWLQTGFASNIFNESFDIIKKMNNFELEKHMKPFENVNLDKTLDRYILNLKLLVFYTKYLKLYRAYDHSNNFGW